MSDEPEIRLKVCNGEITVDPKGLMRGNEAIKTLLDRVEVLEGLLREALECPRPWGCRIPGAKITKALGEDSHE